MAQDPEITIPPIKEGISAEAGKTDQVDAADNGGYGDDAELDPDGIDRKYWLACLEDAERAEREWRSRGREIIEIYRNETRNSRTGRLSAGPVTFNILYANTEVMLPAVYVKPPTPVVRSRFTQVSEPMLPPPPPMMGPPGMPPGMPPGPAMGPQPEMGAPPGLLPPPGPPPPPEPPPPGLVPDLPPGGAPLGVGPPPMPSPGGAADLLASAAPGAVDAGLGGPPPPPPPFGALPGAPPPPAPTLPQPAASRPPQAVIDTAASVMQKTLEIVLDDEQSDESVKLAIKDVLLPGRGCCRVRWSPEFRKEPVMAGDGMTPLPGGGLPGAPPPTQETKIWERVGDEYLYWEDLLVDPVRAAADMDWIGIRHLFTREALEAEFGDSKQYLALKASNRLGDIFKWTEESAAKTAVGGGSALKSAQHLGDHIKKAMVWELWDRATKRIIWFIREAAGIVLRVDPDSYQLDGFYPIPVPMLAIRTTDSRIPRPYYDLYAKLAADLDEVSSRISNVTKMIKIRGAYNSASNDIADILTAGDGKMIPVDGVDMINGGLANHIWLVPVENWMNALDKLLIAKEQLKQSIYEIMGISDIQRGATKASETATAQRIKGSMGMSRMEDFKQTSGNFVRDLLRLKAEIIAKNFDQATLELMTGEKVGDEVMAILRSDFMRTCAIDIETDSTVVPDLQAEQEGMAQTMQAIQGVMMGTQQMLMTGILPPAMVMQLGLEMLKMFLHPIRFSRGVTEMINDFQEILKQQIAMQAMMPPAAAAAGAPPPAQGTPPGPAKANGAGAGPPGGAPPPGGPPPGPPPGAGNGMAPPPF